MGMNVAYASDDKFVRHMYVSIMSLLETHTHVKELNLYVVDNNISEENKERLNTMVVAYHRKIKFLSFKLVEKELKGVTLWGGSLAAYARLFLARYLDEDVVLYLDGDSVVVGDLEELFQLNIDDYYIAAVQDTAGPKARTEIGMLKEERYVNSGFTLINLKKWREDNLEERFLNFIFDYNGNVPCCDQGTLNGVCKEKILIIHPRYNLMTPMLTFKSAEIEEFFEVANYYSQQELDEAKTKPVFIHYVGGFFSRPWFKNGDHPKKDLYRFYMEKSPWKGQYLSKEKMGIRSEGLKFTYKYLPFPMFISLYRTLRHLKQILRKK